MPNVAGIGNNSTFARKLKEFDLELQPVISAVRHWFEGRPSAPFKGKCAYAYGGKYVVDYEFNEKTRTLSCVDITRA